MVDAVEKVSLFPGWASRSYHNSEANPQEGDINSAGSNCLCNSSYILIGSEFSLDVFVSGFAASYLPPEAATRSQRAFMKLAKGVLT